MGGLNRQASLTLFPHRAHGSMLKAGGLAMDRREQKSLEDEINRGVRNVGIYKVDPEGLEKENRSPIFKGAVSGFGFACPVALAYVGVYSIFDPSPRYVSSGDQVVMVLILAGGAVMGALFGWLVSKAPTRGKPKGTTAVVKRDQ